MLKSTETKKAKRMKKTIDPIEPKEYSDDLLRCKVNSFVTAPRMLNQSMRRIIAGSAEESFDKVLGYCLSKGWNDAIIRERFTQVLLIGGLAVKDVLPLVCQSVMVLRMGVALEMVS